MASLPVRAVIGCFFTFSFQYTNLFPWFGIFSHLHTGQMCLFWEQLKFIQKEGVVFWRRGSLGKFPPDVCIYC